MIKKKSKKKVLQALFLLFIVSLLPFQCSKKQKKHKVENLIFVLIDALRADHVSAYNYQRKTTPNIDALAQHSITCLNAYSQSNWTSPSTASIFTGTYVFIHKIFNQPGRIKGRYSVLPKKLTIIPEALKSRKLYTVGFTSQGWISKESNYDQGFDRLELLKREDHLIFERAITFIKEKKRNFFLYLHLLDLHDYCFLKNNHKEFLRSSYKLSEKMRGLHGKEPKKIVEKLIGSKELDWLSSEDLTYLIDRYDSTLYYTDRLIGNLVGTLQDEKILNKTVIIITSDHGERFFEHKELLHGGKTLYNEVVHIPIIIHNNILFPRQKKVTSLTESIDIFPTILDLFSVPDIKIGNIKQLQGSSILRPDSEKVVLIENSHRDMVKLIKDKWSYIYHKKGKIKKIELYDLDHDPYEKENVAGKYKAVARKMFKLMEAKIKKGMKLSREIDPKKARMKKKTKEVLKSLGYIQ